MTLKEKLNHLEELLEIDEDTLTEENEIHQLKQWDSMAFIAIIAMFDDVFGKIITPEKVRSFKTIKDIIDEME